MAWLALKAIFGLTVLTIAAFGAGAPIAMLLTSGYRRFERITFVLLGGFGILSTALFLVGQIWFTPRSIALTSTVAIALAVVLFRRVFPHREPVLPAGPGIPKLPAIIVASVLLFTAVSGLAEITGDWNSDTVAYHLLGPKVWLRNGVIRPVLDDSHTAFPQIPETLFATLWSIGGSRAPNFSSFLTFALLLATAGSIAVRLGLGGREAWWLAAIVAAMPAVYAGAVGCFVDAIFAAFVLAAVRIGLDAQSPREWAVFGLFSGFAIGTKYTGLLAIPALLICILLLNLKRNTPQSRGIARKLALAIAVACLVSAPYYIRNEVLLGCPIYPPPPGYALICSPKYFPADAISQFLAYIRQRGMGMGHGVVAFVLLPFNLTYHTSNFNGAGGIGLCFFALGPFGIWRYRKNTHAQMLVLFMFLLTAAWFFTEQESRFLIDVYILGAVFAVLGWHSILESRRRISHYLACTVVIVSCSYGLFMIGKASRNNARSVFSLGYARIRRQNSIPYLPSFEYLNGQPSVRTVLILDRSVPPFYLDKDYVKPVGQWGERTLPAGPGSLQALELAREHRLHVSDVLDVDSQISPFQVDPHLPGLTLVFEAKNQRIYRID